VGNEIDLFNIAEGTLTRCDLSYTIRILAYEIAVDATIPAYSVYGEI
jgi:hypothetical protein